MASGRFARARYSLLLAAVVAAAVIIGLALTSNQGKQNVSVVVDGVNRWCLPNAVTVKQQQDGLRDSTQTGMVFTFSPPIAQAFWNQGVSRQIFIVWVRDEQVIGTGVLLPFDSTYLYPPSAIDHAIELTPGIWSAQWHTVTIRPTCS